MAPCARAQCDGVAAATRAARALRPRHAAALAAPPTPRRAAAAGRALRHGRRHVAAPRAVLEHVDPAHLWDVAVGVGLPCTARAHNIARVNPSASHAASMARHVAWRRRAHRCRRRRLTRAAHRQLWRGAAHAQPLCAWRARTLCARTHSQRKDCPA
jgi:hypothetical protein